MKKIALLILVAVLSVTIHSFRQPTPPGTSASASHSAYKTLADKKPSVDPSDKKAAAKTEQKKAEPAAPAPAPTPAPETCRSAIAKVWPAHLQAGAITVTTHENRTELPAAIGAVNFDGSRDFGCFQINDRWHRGYFSGGDWRDPVWAATYALRIYRERQARNGNGWSAWYAVRGVLW